MANEITVECSIKCTNDNFIMPKLGGSQQIDQALPVGGCPGLFSVPTTDTIIPLTGITTLGWVFIKNLDESNFVDFGPTSGGAIVPMTRVLPGEWTVFRLKPGIVLRGIADTAACNCQIVLFNN